jgi:hypothetical protein
MFELTPDFQVSQIIFVLLLFVIVAMILYLILSTWNYDQSWHRQEEKKFTPSFTPSTFGYSNARTLTAPPEKTVSNIVDYLVDPDSKFLHVFVKPDAISQFVIGKMPFTEEAKDDSNIKLVRCGTGFRVYNHPAVKEGQWLSCR